MSNAELVNRVDGLMCRRADMLSVAELQDLRDAITALSSQDDSRDRALEAAATAIDNAAKPFNEVSAKVAIRLLKSKPADTMADDCPPAPEVKAQGLEGWTHERFVEDRCSSGDFVTFHELKAFAAKIDELRELDRRSQALEVTP